MQCPATGEGLSSEKSEITLREHWRRKALAAHKAHTMEGAHTHTRQTTRHYEQAESMRFSPKHSYSARFHARAATPVQLSPPKQQQQQQQELQAAGDCIPAFRPGGQALSRSLTLPAQRGKSYTDLAAAKSPPKMGVAEPAHNVSPSDNVSEMSTVQRAVNAAIADSVAGMLCTPPEASFQPVGWAATQQQQQQQRHITPGSQADAPPSVVSISPFGYLEVPQSASQAGVEAPASDIPAPPPEPALSPVPILSETTVQQTLSPTFMTSRSKPLLCELDDPGSAIRFPKQRRGSRLQRIFGRIMPCFVPRPEQELGRAYSTPIPGARACQGQSPELPKLAIPIEPLRRSMAGLQGAIGAGEPGQGPSEAAAPPGVAVIQAGSAVQQAPHPTRARQSPPHADLLGLLEVEPSDVIINIASPVLPTQPNSCYASQCATPAEQLVATNLLSARQEAEAGAAAGQGQSQGLHAKRNLMELLHSRAEGFGAMTKPAQAEAVVQQQQGAAQQADGCFEQPPAESNPPQDAEMGSRNQGVDMTAGDPAADVPLQQQEQRQQQQGAFPQLPQKHSEHAAQQLHPRQPAPLQPQQQLVQQHPQAPPQPPAEPDTTGQTLQWLLQQFGSTGIQGRTNSESESADAHLAAVLAGQQLQPRPALGRPSKASSRKSPVKHTVVSLSQLMTKRRISSPGSVKKRQQQQAAHEARRSALQEAPLPDLVALQAQRQLVAAKAPAISRRPAASGRGLRGVPAGKRDLSRPPYRSAALHAMLSPGRAMQDLHRTRSNNAPSRQQSLALVASVSAPSSPGGRTRAGSSVKQAAVSMPSSPVGHAQLTQPSILPRMNKASAARMAALQRKLQPKKQLWAPAGAHSSAPAPAVAAALSGPAGGRFARQLASPELSARPHYRQGTATPSHTIPAFSAGEAGVEPYSAQPMQRQHKAVASAPAAPPPAQTKHSPLSMNAYQADRAEYLQILTQLALGLDVNPEAIAGFKQQTVPPLPPGVLEAAAAQARREGDNGAETVRPRGPAAEGPKPSRAPAQGGRVVPAAPKVASAALPRSSSSGARGALVPAGHVAQSDAPRVEEEDRDSCSQLTTKTLVYSLVSVTSSSELAGSEGALTPHSNDLYQSLEDTGSPRPAAAQRLRSFTAAVEHARRSEEERWQRQQGGDKQGPWREHAGFAAQAPAQPSDSQLTDPYGRGAVAAGAAGQQTVSKPAWPRA